VIPQPGATTWIRISGTDAKIGDGVAVEFEGLRVNFDTNPAQRELSAAGPGALGVNPIPEGEIEIALNGTNIDGTRVRWRLVRGA